jgi:uncharacterized tellurite resistance protein B-like protein
MGLVGHGREHTARRVEGKPAGLVPPGGGVIRRAMIERLKALFGAGDEAEGRPGDDGLRLAAAALLAEAAHMDGHVDDRERETIRALLSDRFGLAPEDAAALLEAGMEAVQSTGQLYAFTRVIKDRYAQEDRVRMIEMLWEVAAADGHIDHFEANLVRRVAGLLYVPDRDSGLARQRVLERLGRDPVA